MTKALQYRCSSDYGQYRDRMITLHRKGGGDISSPLYDSYYTGNPYGDPLLGLCFDGENLVGQENYIMHNVACRGQVYRGALGLNTFVDPQYRLFHGVFGKLCKLTIDELKERVDILLAFANEESQKYYLKYFQWRIASKVRVYKKATRFSGINAESLLSLFRPGKSVKDLELQETERFDSDILKPVIDIHLQNVPYCYFYKTPEFLNWKFLGNQHYHVKGYYILSRGVCSGYCVTYDAGMERKIVDFMVDKDDAGLFIKVLSALSNKARKEGMKRLVVHATPGCWYEGSLKRYAFIPRWEYDFITRSLSEQMPSAGWVVQIGDFDIF